MRPLMEVIAIPLLALVLLISFLLTGRDETPQRQRPPRAEPVDLDVERHRIFPLPRHFPVGPDRDELR